MAYRYKNIDELRRKKELLKKEVSEMGDLLSFDNAKESLSAFTNGFTDRYLTEVRDEDGGTSLGLNKDAIIQEVRQEVKDRVFNRSAVLGFANSASKNGLVEDAIRLGITTFVGNYARKNIKNSSWKKRVIGMVLIYIAPYVLRFLRNKIETYQKNKSVSSFEQLI